jgi:hypothetical protein
MDPTTSEALSATIDANRRPHDSRPVGLLALKAITPSTALSARTHLGLSRHHQPGVFPDIDRGRWPAHSKPEHERSVRG